MNIEELCTELRKDFQGGDSLNRRSEACLTLEALERLSKQPREKPASQAAHLLACDRCRKLYDTFARHAAQRQRRFFMVVLASVSAAAAAFVMFLLLWPIKKDVQEVQLALREFRVEPERVRDEPDAFTVTLSLNRPSYVRLIAIDERRERWLLDLDPDKETALYVKKFDSVFSAVYPMWQDPSKEARATHLMIVVSAEPPPSDKQVEEIIPDPILPPELATDMTVLEELEKSSRRFQERFGCEVHIAPIR